ncbi:MFS-type transporter SLC18B1-like [Ixodes scapularis]|uniref:MFS-type transporter SLC18B1-like n=1 Tax=Ixodes scapularis TaxID=6945 RepID=UPI001C38D16A|nr:MFS-type transporter SLC18B1-like [Ixodes scapularis]
MFVGSLLGNKMMKATSPLTCYLVGQIGFVIFTVTFGCLFWAPAGNVFLGLSFLLVVLGGFSNTLYLVAMFALFTTRFQKGAGLIMALLEILWGTGNMVGSPIGGALIDLWAFPLPFFVLGFITIVSFPMTVKLGSSLNKLGRSSTSEDDAKQSGVKYRNLFRDVEFVAYLVAPMLCWIMLGFNEPTLAPSVAEFNISSTQTGELYTVQFGSYTIGGAIAGILCFFNGEALYQFVGNIFAVLAFLMVGPAPFLELKRELWVVHLSQVFTGLGMSALFICGYSRALKLVVLRGYPYNIHSNGFVSSSVFTFAVFGAMIMPPIAGYLVDTFGYRIASLAMFGLLLAWLPVTFVLWMKSLCFPDQRRLLNETE